MAKLPFPPANPNAYAEITIEGGMTPNGSFEAKSILEGMVHYIERIKTISLSDGSKITSVGKIIVSNDISPGNPLRGSVRVSRDSQVLSLKIAQGSRHFNPDGSVHHVELELM